MDNAIQRTRQVQQVLKVTYGLVPIIAGIDKFTNLLTNWKDYLSVSITNMLPFSATTFMYIVGIIEIVAGLLVFLRPRIGAWVVMAWLILIACTLIFGGHYFDVAVRDLVMAVGAFALGKLLLNEDGIKMRGNIN
ncbi:MAG: DoxX family rane protein [Ferruginibacter sp.]|nr:DoxX family rane protein [Ferruginibacter sp.]